MKRLGSLLVFACLTSMVLAQTDYFYSLSGPYKADGIRMLKAIAINSQGIRMLPEAPYPLEYSERDLQPRWIGMLAIDDPGPFLYCSRPDPDQLYGYRRLVDGHLQLLPGFPITFPRNPGTAGLEIVNLVKHPSLPVLYQINFIEGLISVYRIDSEGALTELAGSPFDFDPVIQGGMGFVVVASGTHAFVNEGPNRGIASLSLDPISGAPLEARLEVTLPGRDLGLVLSDDGRYLYACRRYFEEIYGFAVDGRELTPLPGSPYPLPFVPSWPATHGRFLALGAEERMLGLMLIGSDGSLSWAPGSPREVGTFANYYAAFSPRGDRVFFASNGATHYFDVAADGRMTYGPDSPLFHYFWGFGVATAPEPVGDPFSLRFEPYPILGDTEVRVHGDAHTPFYLSLNGTCQGPYTTDGQGETTIPLTIANDQQLQIKAYCDETTSADSLVTIPVLTPWGLALLCLGLALTALFQVRIRRGRSPGSGAPTQ